MNIDNLKQVSLQIAEKYALDFVVLFGSRARGKTHKNSDVDIAIKASHELENIVDITCEFYTLLNREDVEVVDLKYASPTLMMAISKDGKLLFEKNEGAFFSWRVYAFNVWNDTAVLRQARMRQIIYRSEKYKINNYV